MGHPPPPGSYYDGPPPMRPPPGAHRPYGAGPRRVHYTEKNYQQKIYVDGLFPPNVRPASVLIGTKGTNHMRMQTSGCIVQLRGKGCSVPEPGQDPEEPVHLLVKYDTFDQFNRFRDILKEIVEGYQTQSPYRSAPGGGRGRGYNDGGGAKYTGSPTGYASAAVHLVPHWGLEHATADQVASEADLLWLFKVFLVKHQREPCSLDMFEERVCNFYHFESLAPRLAQTTIPPGPQQLLQFIRSVPHVLRLQQADSKALVPVGAELPVDGSFIVVLAASCFDCSKEELKERHNEIRVEQRRALLARTAVPASPPPIPGPPGSGPEALGGGPGPRGGGPGPLGGGPGPAAQGGPVQASPGLATDAPGGDGGLRSPLAAAATWPISPSPQGRPDIPLNTLYLLVQGLHHFVRSEGGSTLADRFETRFEDVYHLPLCFPAMGFRDIREFAAAHPGVFYLTARPDGAAVVNAVSKPDFANPFTPSKEHQFPSQAPAVSAAEMAARSCKLAGVASPAGAAAGLPGCSPPAAGQGPAAAGPGPAAAGPGPPPASPGPAAAPVETKTEPESDVPAAAPQPLAAGALRALLTRATAAAAAAAAPSAASGASHPGKNAAPPLVSPAVAQQAPRLLNILNRISANRAAAEEARKTPK